MRRVMTAAVLASALLAVGSPARAGVYTDDLARCLVKQTTDADRSAFVVWIYSAMSIHPAVSGYSKLTDTERNALSKTAAELLQRLMTEDCRAETIAALKYEGSSAIEGSFNTLGQVAMRDLISNPEVAKSFEKLGSYIDAAKFEALGKDAGLPPPAKPK